MIGFCMTGSFCTHSEALGTLKKLASNYDVMPVMSETAYSTDTRFGLAADTVREVEKLCGRRVIHTVRDAEPLGPAIPLEVMIVLPCTGNTLAKIAGGVTDTAVTMAVKAHLRCSRPLVIGLCSNDAMSANLKNIGTAMNRKNVYFVPMRQDDPVKKPYSLVADFSLAEDALEAAMRGEQLRPAFR